MANLLSSYIDALLAGEMNPVGVKGNQEKVEKQHRADPLDAIRGQYISGEDF